MAHGTTFVGLDVHMATIAIAVCRGTAAPEDRGLIAHEMTGLVKRLDRLGARADLRVCYEAGPCGFTLYRALTARGIACTVIAPSLIPTAPGKRVKTDRRDAAHLARLLRSGDLTAVTVPSPEQEAIRDLSRLRQSAIGDLHRSRQRLLKLFLRMGIGEPREMGRWSKAYLAWVDAIQLTEVAHTVVLNDLRRSIRAGQERVDQLTTALLATAEEGALEPVVADLQQLHGIGAITAIGLAAELGDLRRFTTASQVMAFAGMVPSEHSSGGRTQRGGITKTGNAHVRALLVEAAWHYVRPARVKPAPTTEVERIAAMTRQRLHRRYHRFIARGKPKGVAIVAIARELLGSCWAIANVATPA